MLKKVEVSAVKSLDSRRGIGSMERANDVSGFLAEAVDKCLTNKFGNICKRVIIFHVAKTSDISEDDILRKPDKLASGLEKLLGEGSGVVQRNILKGLHFRFGLGFKERADFTFSEHFEYVAKLIKREKQNGLRDRTA